MKTEKLREHLLAVSKKRNVDAAAESERRAAIDLKKRIDHFTELIEKEFGLPYTPVFDKPEFVIDDETGLAIVYPNKHHTYNSHLALRITCPKCGTEIQTYGFNHDRMIRAIDAFRKWFKETDITSTPDIDVGQWKYHVCFLKKKTTPNDDWHFDLVEKLADVIDMVNGVLHDRHAPEGM